MRTDEIDGVAARTGRPGRSSPALEPARSMGGGWRSVWPAVGPTSGLPFFIQYNISWNEQLRVREADYASAASPAAPGAITRLDLSCDPTMLRAWLDVEIPTDALPLELTVRAAALTSIRIASPRGDIVICG